MLTALLDAPYFMIGAVIATPAKVEVVASAATEPHTADRRSILRI